MLIAGLQLLCSFRHQCLELLLAIENLYRHVREDTRQAADLVRSANHRIHNSTVRLLSRLYLPGGISNDFDGVRQQSRAEERGNSGESKQQERDEGGVPRLALNLQRNFVQADSNAQTADQDSAGVDDR